MIKPKLVQCDECIIGILRPVWKRVKNEEGILVPLCKQHAMMQAAQGQIMKNKSIVDDDEKFYKYIWKKRKHFCEECGKELKEFSFDWFHHLLPKRKGTGGYPYFRHEEKNVLLLCGRFGCHGKAESAISYPKMKIYQRAEKIKKELLATVGIEYDTSKLEKAY